MAEIIFSQRSELRDKIFISYCPERVLPGKILYELQHNDRIIGGINSASTAKAVAFYSQFVQGKLYETNAKTAEMCKLVENSFRDLNIAFANELSMICDTAGINVWELITMANRHPRVKILNPGPGVGGHCIAVDPWFLVDSFKEQATIIRTAREVNNNKTVWVKGKILKAVEAFKATHNRVPVVACMGISFKPDIDDLRESPSFELAKELIADKVNTLVVEPNISQHATMPLVTVDHAVSHGDIIVFLVAHKQFKSINTADKIVLDFCGITRAQCD
jgi:UDP-N-acetyl-D-mannosaminuronic acid dehydrogenase